MLNFLKKLFGAGPKTDYTALVKQGAVILDVRTKNEFSGGHIKGAVNELRNNLPKLKDKNTPVITCCASGVRSAAAKSVLQANGFNNVYNGGSWSNLENKINN